MFSEYIKRKDEIDLLVKNYFPKNEFNDILNYSIEEGKRIRPIIMLDVYNMLGGRDDIVSKYALALEFIHNYSLVHDDLPAMDNDNYRRGRKSTHYKYGEDKGILAGDALLNYAYELLFETIIKNNDTDYIKAAGYIANAAGKDGMINGQILDVQSNLNSLDKIEEMYKNKTCKLFMSATTVPAYLTHQSEEIVSEMEKLGYYIGMAFQLQDDLLDLEQDRKINKVTYACFLDEERAYSDMIAFTDKAIEILNKYEENEFLIKLINYLKNREV